MINRIKTINSISGHVFFSFQAKIHNEIFDCLSMKAAGLSDSAKKWARLREIELEENQKMREKLNERRIVEKNETRALVETLQVGCNSNFDFFFFTY